MRTKCVLYERYRNSSAEISGEVVKTEVYEAVSIIVCRTLRGNQELQEVHFYREWPGVSPTVNVSWFIAKAYLANLYYTQSHYKAALETCNEVVAVYNQSEWNKVLAERTFPVLLTTQWTAVYDKELQALLGMCSLF